MCFLKALCTSTGLNETEDFCIHEFLCHRWSGRLWGLGFGQRMVPAWLTREGSITPSSYCGLAKLDGFFPSKQSKATLTCTKTPSQVCGSRIWRQITHFTNDLTPLSTNSIQVHSWALLQTPLRKADAATRVLRLCCKNLQQSALSILHNRRSQTIKSFGEN